MPDQSSADTPAPLDVKAVVAALDDDPRRHRLGKSCLYIARLDDIDLVVLAEIVTEGIAYLRATHDVPSH